MILRTRQGGMTAATRRIFGVLIVCWLNLAVLPCAMAIGGSDGCLHMQPAAQQSTPGHEGHHGPDPHADCASMPSNCCELGEATFDGRSDTLADAPDDLFAFIPLTSSPIRVSLPATTHAARPPDRGGSSTPLHVLNCVYLK